MVQNAYCKLMTDWQIDNSELDDRVVDVGSAVFVCLNIEAPLRQSQAQSNSMNEGPRSTPRHAYITYIRGKNCKLHVV